MISKRCCIPSRVKSIRQNKMYGRYGKTAAEVAGKMNPNIAANIRSRDE